LHLSGNYCTDLKSGVNFQLALKPNYATEVTYNETCLSAKIWLCQLTLGFCSFNPVASALGWEDTWRLLATTFDVM
jgi:hypothetical protein